MLAGLCLCLFLFAVAVVASAALNVFFRGTLALRPRTIRPPLKVCIVLGSGGHTSEMFRSLHCLPDNFLRPHQLCYVVSATDTHSAQLARKHDQERFGRTAEIYTIPRAREVGQSYVSSIKTTLVALMSALRVVRGCRPDVLLVNGPGVCVPVVLAAAFWTAVLPWRFRYPTTAYVESFTCVAHLSLTGKLLTPFLCDVVAYHWKSLGPVIAARQRVGTRTFIGASDAACVDAPRLTETATYQSGATSKADDTAERYAVLTVGSTYFDELVAVGVTPAVCWALHTQFGVSRLYIQHGTTPLDLSKLVDVETDKEPAGTGAEAATTTTQAAVQRGRLAGLSIEAFAYRPGLSTLLAGAHVVLTHAGAGTILECLEARRLTVVVPNHRLMSDHQLELAVALDKGQFLYCVNVENLAQRLKSGDVDAAHVRVFPGIDGEALTAALRAPLTGEVAKAA